MTLRSFPFKTGAALAMAMAVVASGTASAGFIVLNSNHSYVDFDGGSIDISVTVEDNYLGNPALYRWMYEVTNQSYDPWPASASGATGFSSNGFSGFRLSLAAIVPELAYLEPLGFATGNPACNLLGIPDPASIEWCKKAGDGALPGNSLVFSFTTAPRQVTTPGSALSYYYSWVNGDQFDLASERVQTDAQFFAANGASLPEAPGQLLAAPIPEPTTVVLLGLGLAGLGLRRRRSGNQPKENRRMRRDKAGSYVGAVVGGLLMATAAGAADPPPPLSCSIPSLSQNIVVTQFCTVNCSEAANLNPLACDPAGACTGIEYKITAPSLPDFISTLVRGGVVQPGPGVSIYTACVGDPAIRLGYRGCHEQAVRLMHELPDVTLHKLVVAGLKQKVSTTVAVRNFPNVGSCEVAGLGTSGAPLNPAAQVMRTETRVFKGCAVKFTLDVATGTVLSAANDPAASDEGANCSPVQVNNAGQLQLFLGELSLGGGNFLPDFTMISTGTASCTSLVIGGRVYTWGDPCP